MALPLPNLDDRTYAELVAEAIERIPVECPEWTDHNPSDTGIILIELLAWLTEMTLYRVNQVPDRNIASFLGLLKGEDWGKSEKWNQLSKLSADQRQVQLKTEIQSTLQQLRKCYRAITPADFEHLILEEWHQTLKAQKFGDAAKIDRVKVLPQAQGHIRLVIVPIPPKNDPFERSANASEDLKAALKDFLDERRLLTTRLHVELYKSVDVNIRMRLVLVNGASLEDVRDQAIVELQKFFQLTTDPQNPYWEGQGWPFGRNVYRSELYKLLNGLRGVDYVSNLEFLNSSTPPLSTLEEITLNADQLAIIKLTANNFQLDAKNNTVSLNQDKAAGGESENAK